MNIVFTGTAKINGEHYDRKRLTTMAELYGHYVQKNVDWGTNLLVVGDETHTTIKKAKAIRMKKRIVTVKEFLEMMFTQ
jgi:NAD-dependent DNA ligase